MKTLIAILLGLAMSWSAWAQTNIPAIVLPAPQVNTHPILGNWSTNEYYHAGEITLELAPTITASSLFNIKRSHTYGMSLEYEYWQTLTTGTGLEIGTTDWHAQNIDHFAVMEDYRLVYLPKSLLWDKFALVAKMGAETYFNDGTKSLELGVGINYNLFVKTFRVEASVMQHFNTNPSRDGSTFRVGLQYIF